MIDRIILLIAGLVLTFFAFWIGADVHAGHISDADANGGIVVLAIVGLVAGIWATVYGLVYAIRRIVRQDTQYSEGVHLIAALTGSIGSAFCFSEAVGTFSRTWMSPWDSLLVVGFLPLVFLLKDLAVEIKTKRRGKTERPGVTKLHA